jgi:hypothetical protein
VIYLECFIICILLFVCITIFASCYFTGVANVEGQNKRLASICVWAIDAQYCAIVDINILPTCPSETQSSEFQELNGPQHSMLRILDHVMAQGCSQHLRIARWLAI